jgi:hypothetical protein
LPCQRCGVASGFAPRPLLLVFLSSSVRLGDLAAQFVIVAEVDVVQIQAVQQPFLLNLAGKLLNLAVNIPLVDVARADERAQRRLVLDLTTAHLVDGLLPPPRVAPPVSPVAGSRVGVQVVGVLAAFLSGSSPAVVLSVAVGALATWVSASSGTLRRRAVPPSSLSQGLGRLDADLPQAEPSHLLDEPPVFLFQPPSFGGRADDVLPRYNLVAALEGLQQLILLGLRPVFVGVRGDEHVEEGGDGGVVRRVAHGSAA